MKQWAGIVPAAQVSTRQLDWRIYDRLVGAGESSQKINEDLRLIRLALAWASDDERRVGRLPWSRAEVPVADIRGDLLTNHRKLMSPETQVAFQAALPDSLSDRCHLMSLTGIASNHLATIEPEDLLQTDEGWWLQIFGEDEPLYFPICSEAAELVRRAISRARGTAPFPSLRSSDWWPDWKRAVEDTQIYVTPLDFWSAGRMRLHVEGMEYDAIDRLCSLKMSPSELDTMDMKQTRQWFAALALGSKTLERRRHYKSSQFQEWQLH